MWNGNVVRDDSRYALAIGIALGAGDVIAAQRREIEALRETARMRKLKTEMQAAVDEAQAILDAEVAKRDAYQRRAAAGAARMLAARARRKA